MATWYRVQYRVQYSTVQYSTVQYNTVQYSTVQYSTVQCSTVQYSTVQHSTVRCSTVQYLDALDRQSTECRIGTPIGTHVSKRRFALARVLVAAYASSVPDIA
eukprot:3343108-Rhodomonas_salina.3